MEAMFSETNLIYGPELSASFQKVAGQGVDLGRKVITLYIDSNNAKLALIKADS